MSGAPRIIDCPTLAELPAPLSGKAGWPWTVGTANQWSPVPPTVLPCITIVTPSFNQAQYLEETIRSVLLQAYPNLEYIIIDGGSTDGSVDIIRKYEKWLTYWISEPDQGQSHAVDKGWAKGSGEILAYLNSDDTYLPNAIHNAIRALISAPHAPAVCGTELLIDSDGMVIRERQVQVATQREILSFHFLPQPAVFIRRAALEKVGGIGFEIQTSFDFELWTRLVRQGDFKCIPDVLATTRWYPTTKTMLRRMQIASELERIMKKIFAYPAAKPLSWQDRAYIRACLSFVLVSIYLEHDPVRHASPILKHLSIAILVWLPITPAILRLIFANLLHRAILFYLRVFKHKNIDEITAIRGRTGIHWSRWQSRSVREV